MLGLHPHPQHTPIQFGSPSSSGRCCVDSCVHRGEQYGPCVPGGEVFLYCFAAVWSWVLPGPFKLTTQRESPPQVTKHLFMRHISQYRNEKQKLAQQKAAKLLWDHLLILTCSEALHIAALYFASELEGCLWWLQLPPLFLLLLKRVVFVTVAEASCLLFPQPWMSFHFQGCFHLIIQACSYVHSRQGQVWKSVQDRMLEPSVLPKA